MFNLAAQSDRAGTRASSFAWCLMVLVLGGCATANNKFILSRPQPAVVADALSPIAPPAGTTATINGRDFAVTAEHAVEDMQDLSVLSPHDGVIWPGALIVGHSDGSAGVVTPITSNLAPQLLTLNNVSAPGPGGINSAVKHPSNDAFQQARLQLLTGASSPANFHLEVSQVYSAEDAATKIGASFTWLSGDIKSTFQQMDYAQTQVYVARFTEKYCTISVNSPPSGTPIDYFSWVTRNFTPASDFARLLTMPDESFLFVQNVTYGRMGIAAFTSTYTRDQIQAALEAEYHAAASGGHFQASSDDDKVAKSLHSQLIIYGGSDAIGYQAMDGDLLTGLRMWAQSGNGNLLEGLPVSYTLAALKDGMPVALHAEYNYSQYTPFALYDSFVVEFDTGGDDKDHDTFYYLDIYHQDTTHHIADAGVQGFVDRPYVENTSVSLPLTTDAKLSGNDDTGMFLRFKLQTNGDDTWILNNIVITGTDSGTGDQTVWETGPFTLNMSSWNYNNPADQPSFPLRKR